jgi:hypothetical protein
MRVGRRGIGRREEPRFRVTVALVNTPMSVRFNGGVRYKVRTPIEAFTQAPFR